MDKGNDFPLHLSLNTFSFSCKYHCRMEGVDRGVPHSQFPPPFPPLPSPFPPTSLPFPPTSLPFSPTSLPLLDFSLPLINFVLIQCNLYVSEELRMVHHRLSCRIFMHNYSVGKEPDFLQINVFSRTSKGNIIYTRQNNDLLFMVTFGAYSILSLFGILRSRLFKGFLFYFFHTKSL